MLLNEDIFESQEKIRYWICYSITAILVVLLVSLAGWLIGDFAMDVWNWLVMYYTYTVGDWKGR